MKDIQWLCMRGRRVPHAKASAETRVTVSVCVMLPIVASTLAPQACCVVLCLIFV